MTILLISLAASFQVPISIDGLPGGDLIYSETGEMECSISISLNGERVSEWIEYPLRFNPAKTFCEFNPELSTLEVQSQMPYSADYTYALYLVDEKWELTLLDNGDGDYYGRTRTRIVTLLEEGEFQEACYSAMEIMYPGAFPYPDDLSAEFVIAAAELGTAEAFELAGEVSRNLSGLEPYELQTDNPGYPGALAVYAETADTETAVLVRERIDNFE